MSAAVIAASYVASGFSDTFNRSDRELVGDNAWIPMQVSPGTGNYSITSNRLRSASGAAGFPGSAGSLGGGVAHDVVHADPDVADVSFDIVTGTSPGGYSIVAVIAATKSVGTPAFLDSGVLLRYFTLDPAGVNLNKITATNSTGATQNPAGGTINASTTTTVRLVLTRSTGVVQMYLNGSLFFTSAAAFASGLTGSLIYLQMQTGYGTATIEFDNVVAV